MVNHGQNQDQTDQTDQTDEGDRVEDDEDEVKSEKSEKSEESEASEPEKKGDTDQVNHDEMSLIDWVYKKMGASQDQKPKQSKNKLKRSFPECEFRSWWIRRHLTILNRPIKGLTIVTLPLFAIYIMLNIVVPAQNFNAGTGAAIDRYTANEVVPQFVVAWLAIAAFAIFSTILPQKQWTVITPSGSCSSPLEMRPTSIA